MGTQCDMCAHYEYDEEYDYYTCQMNLDEDELYRFVTSTWDNCPYYRNGDEYAIVKHQL